MKRLLNNPIVVGAMALVAALIVYINVIRPLMPKSAPPPEQVADAGAATPGKAPAAPVVTAALAIDYSAAGWAPAPRRDPFSSVPLSPIGAAAERPKQAKDMLQLTAIVIEPGYRAASINKSFVKVGQNVDNYRVIGIAPEEVTVAGPLGRETITFAWNRGGPGSAAFKGIQ
ncbi:MAG: hypothetical protein HZB29_08790 [Nitrospinae bacterium]|nr:hypothetical protein [Nitrospinota bacterium]